MAATNMTAGKAKKSGEPRKAPKVAPPSKKAPNYMKEADTKLRLKSKMWPLKQKRLSK
jgi:curved DNA-binding protein CbpA|tara:strand:+ start:821 stop:994 length:174 start_codon:yes stop_codon:yes gene_type:complete